MVGRQALTMPRLGSAVDQMETIPRDPWDGFSHVSEVKRRFGLVGGGGKRRLAGLTGSVHVGVRNQLHETDKTDDTGSRQC